jgi:hypothetical protein
MTLDSYNHAVATGGECVSVDRFATPFYGIGEVAAYLAVPPWRPSAPAATQTPRH